MHPDEQTCPPEPLREIESLRERIARLEEEVRRGRAVETELRKERSALLQIIHTMPQSIFWKDRGSVFLGCNEAFVRAVGLNGPADVIGKTDFDMPVPREDAEVYVADDRDVITSGKPKPHIIEPIRKPDGSRIWVDTTKVPLTDGDGQVMGVLGVYEDITDRVRGEAALRESRRMLQLVLDTIPVRVFWKDRNSVLLGCNRLFAADAGVASPEKIIGKTDYEMGWRDQAEQYRADDQLVMSTGNPKLNYEEPQTTPKGETIWLRTSKIPLRDETGDIIGILGTYEDITAWKNAQEERRRLEAQLQHTQKLESLGVLAGGIAHDFNNLLTAILGNAELALIEAPAPSTSRTCLEEIDKASRRAAGLCQQMLAYSGRGHFVIEPVSLNDVVIDMTAMLEMSITKKARLQSDLAAGLPAIQADVTQIRQVLMNLVTNASEAIGDRGGVITIRTGSGHCGEGDLRETYFTEDLPEGRYVFLDVADGGCGMTPEVRARIFDPFFTTKFAGRGLGLAAVLGIVRGHRGAIRVRSEAGRGTAIRIFFPASGERLRAEPAAPPAEAESWTGSGLLLLAEDEPAVRDVARRMVEAIGFRVITAADGREALEQLHHHQTELRAVLMDLTMPLLDGEEAFRAMHQAAPHIPVILSSGYNEQEVSERFSGSRPAGFIQKPYQLETLRSTLRAALAGGASPRRPGDLPPGR